MNRKVSLRVMGAFTLRICTGAALLLAYMQAMAVNKCTGKDGSVVYQDAPCSNTAASNEKVKTWSNTPGESGPSRAAWRFVDYRDDMTGRRTCAAAIDDYVFITARRETTLVTVGVVARDSGAFLQLQTSSGRPSFHNDVGGTGMKVDRHNFVPLQRLGSDALTVSALVEAEVLKQLETGSEFRLRLRFWPYDDLVDTSPISLAGFRQAMASARACAAARSAAAANPPR